MKEMMSQRSAIEKVDLFSNLVFVTLYLMNPPDF